MDNSNVVYEPVIETQPAADIQPVTDIQPVADIQPLQLPKPFENLSLKDFMHHFKATKMSKFSFYGLTKEQRQQVHSMADEFELQHISKGPIDKRVITIAALDTVIGSPTTARTIRSDLLQSARYEIENAPVVALTLEKQKTPPKRKPGRPRKNKEAQEPISNATTTNKNNETSENQPKYFLRTKRI